MDYCVNCGREIEEIDVCTETKDGFACEYCDHLYVECRECGELFHRYKEDSPLYEICKDCFQDLYFECSQCNDFFLWDEREEHHTVQGYICPGCYTEIQEGIIYEWDYKPFPQFQKTGKEEEITRFFGIEIEIDEGGECRRNAGEINKYLPFAYMKHDGSLNDGFEMVTHPMSYNFLYDNRYCFKGAFDEARQLGYTSHDAGTCGLHVHVSKKALGEGTIRELNIGKILYLVEKFWEFNVRFSRRNPGQLQEWAARYFTPSEAHSIPETEKIGVLLEKTNFSDRYMAVNLENIATIEFRFFRGTLKLNTFIATVQYVNYLIDTVLGKNVEELHKMVLSEFIQGMKNYPELTQYLNERGL